MAFCVCGVTHYRAALFWTLAFECIVNTKKKAVFFVDIRVRRGDEDVGDSIARPMDVRSSRPNVRLRACDTQGRRTTEIMHTATQRDAYRTGETA